MGKSINTKVTDIIIVGAGAAGMMAAIVSANMGKQVILIEGSDRPGTKILSTGNGKCNISNLKISSAGFNGSGKIRFDDYFSLFDVDQTIDFFKSIGLLIRNRDEYLYPYSEQASSVLDVLRFAVKNNKNITLVTDYKVASIIKKDNVFIVTNTVDDIEFNSKRVILSTGGCAAPKTGSDGSGYELAKKIGHTIIKPCPALVKIKSSSDICKTIDGVRAKAQISLYKNNEFTGIDEKGEIQFTKDGLSGIPVFNMSGFISRNLFNSHISVKIDLLPDYSLKELEDLLLYKCNEKGNTAEEAFTGIVNKKLMLGCMKKMEIAPSSNACELSIKKVTKLCEMLKNMTFDVIDTYGFEQAQVTSGGIAFNDIDDHLQSKICEGLFIAGEVLDIDGICGGYNLQWAWTSGYVAGKYAALSL